MTSKDRKSVRVNVEYDHATLVRWSPDSKAILIHKAFANTIQVYKVAKKSDGTLVSAGKALEFPKQHEDDVVGMDIASNGRFIVTCSKQNDIVLWDLKGQVLATIDTYLGNTHKVRTSTCGRFVAASGFTTDVKIWEVVFSKSGDFQKVSKCFSLSNHSSGVLDFGFSSDSSNMLTVSKDGTYCFYDTKIEFEKGEKPRMISKGNWEGSSPSHLALTPNAETLAISHGSSLTFYRTTSGSEDDTIHDIFQGPIVCMAFDSLGEYLLVAGDKHVQVFRNVPGLRASIESSKEKLQQKQSSATKERLVKIIDDCKSVLESMNEWCPEE